MNTKILNKDFQHPSDSWYMIEAAGNHPNAAAGMIQVIDGVARQSIVNRFNSDASSGELRHGNEMLIDHEHFSDQPDKETRAYGWLQELQNRDDGIYGRIKWTATGKAAVDGGDYRFFSTEYDPKDLKVVNSEGDSAKSMRPMRLAGLTLTNMNNNRGQKPITNRTRPIEEAMEVFSKSNEVLTEVLRDHVKYSGQARDIIESITNRSLRKAPADGCCPDCDCEMDAGTTPDTLKCPECGTNFASSGEAADSEQQPTVKNKKMKTVCTLLGLSADADETSVHTEVSKLKNRITELEPLATENKTLKNRVAEFDGEQIDGLLDSCGVKEEKIRNRMKTGMEPLKNREERLTYLADFGHVPGKPATTQPRVLNRGTGNAAATEAATGTDEQALTEKIRNRCAELDNGRRTFADRWSQAQRENTAKK